MTLIPQLFVALTSNALEVYNVPQQSKPKDGPEVTRLFSVDLPGHRTDVRTLCLSSDDRILASASSGKLHSFLQVISLVFRVAQAMEHEDHDLYTDYGM